MGTYFEVALWGRDSEYLAAVAEEALTEVQRLDSQLSYFKSESEVSALNAFAWERPVSVDPRLFSLLQRAKELSAESGGAFDITVAPLLRAWGFQGASGSMAEDSEVAAAHQLVGMDLIELNPEDFTVTFAREGVEIDLGAIGKGYAVDRAAKIIRDAEVPGALIHGGTSTAIGIGARPDGTPWPIAIQHPADSEKHLTIVELADSALSVSAVHGKYFTEGDVRYGHVLDPRTGRPVMNALLSAVVCESATDSDALSTALLVSGPPLLDSLTRARPTLRALLALPSESMEVSLLGAGIDANDRRK
jgi:thiamine biosynthesis lipoprotein